MLRPLIALLALTLATPAVATTMFAAETKCPVGGKTFKHMEIGSYTTFGELPDGMPVGTGPFPMPLTECPDNGLVLYRDFDAVDVQRLTPLVLGAEYQAMRTSETPSWRAWWLADHLGTRKDLPWMLLAATWEAKAEPGNVERVTRYQNAFIAAAQAEPLDTHSYASVMLRFRAANALRELGRFDEATRAWSGISVADDVAKDERNPTEVVADLRARLAKLGPAIARRDTRRQPIDLMSEQDAASWCAAPTVPRFKDQAEPLTAFDATYCARPEIKAATDKFVKANAR